jgi:hypothetical protein
MVAATNSTKRMVKIRAQKSGYSYWIATLKITD